MGSYLNLINDWELNNPSPSAPVINYSKVVKPIKLVEQSVPKKVIVDKLNPTLLARKLLAGIEERALSLGWKPSQLVELQKILPCFIPCQIGLISLKSICIELFHNDGSVRGALSFSNNEVEQPWLKHIKK